MNDHGSFQRLAAGTTILAVISYLISVLLLLAVMNFSFSAEAFSGAMISIGSRGATLLRWGMIFDVFGSYLLLTPLALHLCIWLVGLGPFIQRERRALGIVTRLLGFSALIDSVGRFVDIQMIFFIGSSGLFLLVPVCLIGWGIDL